MAYYEVEQGSTKADISFTQIVTRTNLKQCMFVHDLIHLQHVSFESWAWIVQH